MTDIAVTMAIKSKIDLIILNAIALLFYLFVFYQLRIPFEESFMFSTPDAKSYWRVAQWLEVGLESSSVSMRPFLYPLIISVASYFGGFIYLWVIQFVFWILSINLLYRTLQKITQNVILIWIGVGILITNITLIALTFHALTEVTVTFFLSLFIYCLFKYNKDNNQSYFSSMIVFLLVLMALVKPAFYSTFLFILPILIYRNFKKKINSTWSWLLLLLALSPLLIQLQIVQQRTGDWTISKIGTYTFDLYLLPQGIQTIENVARDKAIMRVKSMDSNLKKSYILSHLPTYCKLFVKNIWINLGAKSHYLEPQLNSKQFLRKSMRIINKSYRIFHIVFIIPVFILLWDLFKKKQFETLFVLGIPVFLFYFYLITTGISFWEGDRLVLPIIALWIPIYCFVLDYLPGLRSNN